MAFDEHLCNRIRELLVELKQEPVLEKYMFGGMCFMVRGHMCVGIVKNDLMCRLGLKTQKQVCDLPGCRPMDFTGRAMQGYVFVDGASLRKKEELLVWLQHCLDFNQSLPKK